MKLNKETAQWFIPDGKSVEDGIKRTTHMAIGAHQDDLEIMALDGILKCFGKKDLWYFGVILTNGSGSARGGFYEQYTDEEMINVRKDEQKKAAYVGEFGALALLDYTSAETKDPKNDDIVLELKRLIEAAKPEVLYTHNPADKHDTHIGVVTKVIKALRLMKKEDRPKVVYGCEVWRDLDWLLDEDKVVFNVSDRPNIGNALIEIFDSQIDGAKRYDLAAEGRRYTNATFLSSHVKDKVSLANFAMDLTPLIMDDSLDLAVFTVEAIDRFRDDVLQKINKISGK